MPRLTEPDARTASVLVDELDAGGPQGRGERQDQEVSISDCSALLIVANPTSLFGESPDLGSKEDNNSDIIDYFGFVL
jgi:hypothetical protein